MGCLQNSLISRNSDKFHFFSFPRFSKLFPGIQPLPSEKSWEGNQQQDAQRWWSLSDYDIQCTGRGSRQHSRLPVGTVKLVRMSALSCTTTIIYSPTDCLHDTVFLSSLEQNWSTLVLRGRSSRFCTLSLLFSR